jgi:hypothetical protein
MEAEKMEQMGHLPEQPESPLFRVQGVQTQEQYVCAVTSQQLIRPLNGLYSFLAGVCLYMGLSSLPFLSREGQGHLAGSLFFLLLAALFLGLTLVPPLLARYRYRQDPGRSDRPFDLWFYEDAFQDMDDSGTTPVPYDRLTRILETSRFVFLYQDKVLVSTLGKSNFVRGTGRELVQYLRDHTQASYRYMK